MKIIVTRPSPDGETFAADIAKLGAEPILSPVMAIRPRNVAIDLGGAGAFAFTSSNGVRTFAAISPRRDLPVYAVGPATAATAREAGFRQVEAAGGDVGRLAALIAAAKPSGEILHLAGSDVAGDLVAMLAEQAVRTRRIVLYDAIAADTLTAETKAALATDPSDVGVAFLSARSARLFLSLISTAGLETELAKSVAFCLSEEVAVAARDARWAAIEAAPSRTAEGILALIRRTLDGRKGRKDPAS